MAGPSVGLNAREESAPELLKSGNLERVPKCLIGPHALLSLGTNSIDSRDECE